MSAEAASPAMSKALRDLLQYGEYEIRGRTPIGGPHHQDAAARCVSSRQAMYSRVRRKLARSARLNQIHELKEKLKKLEREREETKIMILSLEEEHQRCMQMSADRRRRPMHELRCVHLPLHLRAASTASTASTATLDASPGAEVAVVTPRKDSGVLAGPGVIGLVLTAASSGGTSMSTPGSISSPALSAHSTPSSRCSRFRELVTSPSFMEMPKVPKQPRKLQMQRSPLALQRSPSRP